MPFNPQEVAIAGVGSYPNWDPSSNVFDRTYARGSCALELARKCQAAGLRLFIADYASSPEWRQRVSQLDNVIIRQRTACNSTRKAGRELLIPELLMADPKIKVVVWTQLEKANIVDVDTLSPMIEPILNGGCLIALPTRKDVLDRPESIVLETYPEYMATSELAGIAELDELLVEFGYKKPGNPYDTYSGIVIMSHRVLSHMHLLYARQHYSPIKSTDETGLLLPYLFMSVGLPVGRPTAPFRYSALQFQNELLPSNRAYFKNHRLMQRTGLCNELITQHRFIQTLNRDEILLWFVSK